jgi:hypothetical protein
LVANGLLGVVAGEGIDAGQLEETGDGVVVLGELRVWCGRVHGAVTWSAHPAAVTAQPLSRAFTPLQIRRKHAPAQVPVVGHPWHLRTANMIQLY